MNKQNPRSTEVAALDKQRHTTMIAGFPVKFQGEENGMLKFIHCRDRHGSRPHPMAVRTEDHNRDRKTVVDVILVPYKRKE